MADERLDAMRWREFAARVCNGENAGMAGLAANLMTREQLQAADMRRDATVLDAVSPPAPEAAC